MGKVKIADNSIWVKHIEQDDPLRGRLSQLKPGQAIDLEVAGVVGRWEKMKVGRDGRPTDGLRPIDGMKAVWTKMQKDRGRIVDVRQVLSADSYLAALGDTMDEWNSPEDEEAFGDL